MQEIAIQGWENIARMFNVHPRTAQRRRKELREAGVIFYINKGKPPRKVVCAFPSMLKAWITAKAAKGEDF